MISTNSTDDSDISLSFNDQGKNEELSSFCIILREERSFPIGTLMTDVLSDGTKRPFLNMKFFIRENELTYARIVRSPNF